MKKILSIFAAVLLVALLALPSFAAGRGSRQCILDCAQQCVSVGNQGAAMMRNRAGQTGTLAASQMNTGTEDQQTVGQNSGNCPYNGECPNGGECLYDGECPYGCQGTGSGNGGNGICARDGSCLNTDGGSTGGNGIQARDGSCGGNGHGACRK